MTQSIEQSLKTQFSDQVFLTARQEGSLFTGKVDEIQVAAEQAAIERLGRVSAIEITSRHAQTVAQDIEHTRRKIKLRDFRSTLLLDSFDKVRTALSDPQGAYAKEVARALMIQKDRLIAEAAFADVITGKNFDTTVTFGNDGGQTISTGSVGATYGKLLNVKQNFIDANIPAMEPLYFAATGQQHTNMMQEEELTSGDFNREYYVEKGTIARALGMEMVWFSGTDSNPVITKSSTTRNCIAWAKSGIRFAVGQEIQVIVNQRPDLNNNWQIQASTFMAAVRVDGARVQKVQCTET